MRGYELRLFAEILLTPFSRWFQRMWKIALMLVHLQLNFAWN